MQIKGRVEIVNLDALSENLSKFQEKVKQLMKPEEKEKAFKLMHKGDILQYYSTVHFGSTIEVLFTEGLNVIFV